MGDDPPRRGSSAGEAGDEATFEVYGRLVVRLTRARRGLWEAFVVGAEGKRRPVAVPVPEHATLDDLPTYLEAAFHEMARPGESIVRVK